MPKNVRDQTSKSNSISFIISSHLSQFQRIHKIFPTNLSLEKLLTPSNTKPPRKKTFSLRPPNGFILYRKDVQQEIIKNNPNVTFKIISTIASKKWKCESEEKKNFFNNLSKVAHLVYLDVCEIYVEQNKEQKEHINFSLYEVENNDEKNLDRPWLQSSIFPTMLVSPNSPNSLHCEKIAEKNKLQKIESNDNAKSVLNLNHHDFPSISSSYNILDIDHSSIPSTSYSSSPLTYENSVSSNNNNNHFEAVNYLEITDFLLSNNTSYQIPSQLYRAGVPSDYECAMDFDHGNNSHMYIFNNVNYFVQENINDITSGTNETFLN